MDAQCEIQIPASARRPAAKRNSLAVSAKFNCGKSQFNPIGRRRRAGRRAVGLSVRERPYPEWNLALSAEVINATLWLEPQRYG
jgi:hypothetical protein